MAFWKSTNVLLTFCFFVSTAEERSARFWSTAAIWFTSFATGEVSFLGSAPAVPAVQHADEEESPDGASSQRGACAVRCSLQPTHS